MMKACFSAAALMMAASALTLASCATSPTTPSRPTTTIPAAETFSLQRARFSDLPGWGQADLAPALTALRRSCQSRASRAPDAQISSAGRYGGTVAQWTAACTAANTVSPGAERAFFETYFEPALVRGPGEARLTAYFEPVIRVSRAPTATLTEPLLRKPNDMVTVDVAAFAAAYDDATLRGAPRALTGQLVGAQVRPYPQRSQITPTPGQVIAYAHPADLYSLQVQGSGRLAFEDGAQERAAFASQNGYRWNSALGALSRSGQLQGGATWQNFRAYIDANPASARTTLNADPSYVFFNEETIGDPNAGPRGAANVNLTPMGSIAIDPAFHPYGALVYVDGQYDGSSFRRLLVAQDTGGAIRRGPMRGDVFFGSGDQAGLAAERMNAPARWWTLLPRGVPIAELHGEARG